MINIELSRYENIKILIGKYTLDQIFFTGVIFIFYLLQPDVVYMFYSFLIIIILNCVFITIPFAIQLRDVELNYICVYDPVINAIEVRTKRFQDIITPERYLTMTIRQVGRKYYVYEGIQGNTIPQQCIILTERGYRTWRGLYSELVQFS